MTTPESATLLADAIEALERVGCQFDFCDGPTLDPEPMVTCYVCETLARCRAGLGLPPRADDEQTWQERHDASMASYMAKATGR